MSGVIDENGVQWEHCHGCLGEGTPDYSERGKWVRIDDLVYERPSIEFPYGRDLCWECGEKSQKAIDQNPALLTIELPKEN